MNLPYTVPAIRFADRVADVTLDVEFEVDWRDDPDGEDTVTVLGMEIRMAIRLEGASLFGTQPLSDLYPGLLAAMVNDPNLAGDIAQRCLEYARDKAIDAACE